MTSQIKSENASKNSTKSTIRTRSAGIIPQDQQQQQQPSTNNNNNNNNTSSTINSLINGLEKTKIKFGWTKIDEEIVIPYLIK